MLREEITDFKVNDFQDLFKISINSDIEVSDFALVIIIVLDRLTIGRVEFLV